MALLLVLSAASAAFARDARAAADPLEGDAAEQAVMKLLQKEKFIRAREEAERILRARPDSLIARFALAQVFHEEEANLPRALYHMRKAEELLRARYGALPQGPLAQRWHRRILLAQEGLLGEMDRRHEQLATLDRYDRIYTPRQDHRRIWPLMKLHRFDEALAIARKSTLSDELETRISGYNGLLSVEFERERPEACFKVAMEAVNATGYQSCILSLNTAEAAFAVLKFGEVERLALKSLQAPLKDCPASAHPHLANLYLARSDFQRAVSAVKEARQAGVQRRLRQQFEMGLTAWLMRLLFTLGQFDKALELAERVLRAPDRVGLTSYSSELMDLIYTIDHHAALLAKLELLEEQASARPFTARLKLWLERSRTQVAAWTARRKALRLLGKGELLLGLVRPYLKPMAPWNSPALIDVAGAGVLGRAIKEVRQRNAGRPALLPYLEALEAEMLYRDGLLEEALARAPRLLAALPKDEVLLRMRVAAWAADAAWRRGKAGDAIELFDQVMYRWPTALRLLGVRLPATVVVTHAGSVTDRIARTLGRSRRLRSLGGVAAKNAFTVQIAQQGDKVALCVSGPRGRRYACGRAELKGLKDADAQVAAAIDAFHTGAFAPMIDLTQQDINSLDGSAVRGEADAVLKEILGP
ncbi:MAG: hypothetical protein IT371_25630 [Deltaproteobacteria bacterium]|nr:hypothetical protein [Deltaproteobacteria bacterium]